MKCDQLLLDWPINESVSLPGNLPHTFCMKFKSFIIQLFYATSGFQKCMVVR